MLTFKGFEGIGNPNRDPFFRRKPWPLREFCLRIGPCRQSSQMHKPQQDPINWYRGVRKRVAHSYEFDYEETQRFYHFVKTEIIPFLPIVNTTMTDTEIFENWMSKSNYNGKRKHKLRQIHDLILGFKHYNDKIYECKSFIKAEMYPEIKEARIINSRSDEFKALVGGYIVLVQETIMHDHYVKHKTPEQIAATLNEIASKYPFVYETDYSSFEGSFRDDFMLNVEFRMFEHVLQNFPHIVKLIKRCYIRENVLHFQRRFKAVFSGSRMSGDMWTSLSNGFSNYCLVKYYLKKESERIGLEIPYDFVVEGDDGFIATGVELPNIQDDARALGFQLKCERKLDKNDLSFCGICEFEGKLVPDINRYLSHYGQCCDQQIIRAFQSRSNRSKRLIKNWIHSKALSLLAVSRGIPVLQAIAQQQLRLGGHLDPRYIDWWENEFYDFSNIQSMKAEPITDSMREFVAKRFKIPIELQLQIEREARSMTKMCYDIVY